MATCAYCNTTILFGGTRSGGLRFCNAKCQQRGGLAIMAGQLPAADVALYLGKVHRGNCPQCAGPGPVDVHVSYRVWSALVMTSWSSRPLVSCRSCGVKRQLGDSLYSLLLGWWGFPWGLVMTPVQLLRNVAGLFRAPDPAAPSSALERILRLHLASQIASNRNGGSPLHSLEPDPARSRHPREGARSLNGIRCRRRRSGV